MSESPKGGELFIVDNGDSDWEGLRRHVCEKLDASLEREKEGNDFLTGARAIVQAVKDGKIQCRVAE